MIFILTYWKVIAAIALAAILVVFACYVTHRLDNQSKQDALTAQKVEISKQCEQAQQTSNEVSHDYQNQLSSLRDELDAAKRVQPHACIPIHTPASTSRHFTATPDKRLHQTNAGLDSNDLLDFAGDAEQVGRQLDACQMFIAKSY